jgi:hypothetical protein
VARRPRSNLAESLGLLPGGDVLPDDGDVVKFYKFYKWYRSEGKPVLLSIKLMEKEMNSGIVNIRGKEYRDELRYRKHQR